MEGNQRQVAWNWRDLIVCYAGAMGLHFLILSYSMAMVRDWAVRCGLDPLTVLFLYSFGLQCILLLAWIAIIIFGIRKRHWRDLGFNRLAFSSWLRYGLGGGFALAVIMVFFSYIMSRSGSEVSAQGIETALRQAQNQPSVLLLVLAACVVAPFYEEVFFRGLLYSYVRGFMPAPFAMLCSGAFFALIHLDIWRFLPLMAGGVCLCYLFEKSGSLWVSILAHGVWNGIMILALLTTCPDLQEDSVCYSLCNREEKRCRFMNMPVQNAVHSRRCKKLLKRRWLCVQIAAAKYIE